MSAQSAIPPRPNLIPLALIWGALIGLGVALLATFISTMLTLLTTPGLDDEARGYILYIIPAFYCGIIFLPFMIASALVGLGFALYYNRQPRRIPTGRATGIAIVTALLVFGIGGLLMLSIFMGSFAPPVGNGESILVTLIWLGPLLLLLMAGYSLLASWLNRKLPT